jgi:hypothetical protein
VNLPISASQVSKIAGTGHCHPASHFFLILDFFIFNHIALVVLVKMNLVSFLIYFIIHFIHLKSALVLVKFFWNIRIINGTVHLISKTQVASKWTDFVRALEAVFD